MAGDDIVHRDRHFLAVGAEDLGLDVPGGGAGRRVECEEVRGGAGLRERPPPCPCLLTFWSAPPRLQRN